MLHTNYHAAVAALIYALGPWYNVAGGSIDLGFYAISQVLGVMGLYCGMRYATSIAAEARRHEVGWAAGFGLCCGLALWNSLTSAYLLIPTFIWMSPLLLRSARGLIATIGGTLLGYVPVLGWIASNRRLPSTGPATLPSTVAERFEILIHHVLREHLGFAAAPDVLAPSPWHQLWPLVIAILVFCFVVATARHRRSLIALARFRVTPRSEMDLVIIAMPIIFLLYCSQKSSLYDGSPRYLFATYPVMALAVAALLPTHLNKRFLAAVGSVLVLTAGPTWGLLHSFPNSGTTNGNNKDLRYSDWQKTVDVLISRGDTAVYSGYWTALPLQYAGNGRVTVGIVVGPDRFSENTSRLSVEPRVSYVIADGEPFDAAILARLKASHVQFTATTVGKMTILDRLNPEPPYGKPGLRPKAAIGQK
jgi:hypothetical protein